jgi:hypothetical protein
MHPCECGGKYVRKHGPLEIQDPFVGPVLLPDVDYEKCDRCGDLILSLETARAVDSSLEARLDEILKQQPIQDFFTAAAAAAALGVTKQALHKNRKVRHGFIYHTMLGGMAFYLKKSVALFKENGDGRFLLHQPPSQDQNGANISHAPFGASYTVHEA